MRERRADAARRYVPDRIRLLLVAEAPPAALDRYFYFEAVAEQDSLFRYVCKVILGYTPARDAKARALAELRSRGVYLVDLKLDPIDRSSLDAFVPQLIERCRTLEPEHVVLIKATVYDAAFAPLRDAGLPVVDVRIPFPGSGQQRRFEVALSRALEVCGVA